VPYIEGDLSTVPDLNFEDVLTQVNSTVIAQLANQKQYTLQGATVKGRLRNQYS